VSQPQKQMGKSNSKHPLLCLTIAFVCAVATCGLSMPAYGDGLTMKSAFPNYTVVEHGGVLLLFIVTNHTKDTVDITNFSIGPAGHTSGDVSDGLSFTGDFFLHIDSFCGSPLAPGASCDLGFEFAGGPGPYPVETDNDSGTQEIIASVTTDNELTAFGRTHVTVTDPVVVPEPASLLLFCTGALVLGVVTVWRSQRKTGLIV
jgi:hypothetical protein